jgi:DNA (cytosine-5)-methyltransferase 1
MKVLDLFSGIGGFSLGLESTGYFKTIAFCEKDKFCQKVLQKNFPNIPIESEVRDVKGEKYAAEVVTGGFPCQPFSVAGKRKGTEDDRYLWDETIRIVAETKPKWFIGENVEGIINIQKGMVLRQVQTDLEREGFQVQCLVIPASGIGAWHQRKRTWIIANSNSGLSIGKNEEVQTRGDTITGSGENDSNSTIRRWQKCEPKSKKKNDIGKICKNVSDTNSDLRKWRGTEFKSRDDKEWGFYSEEEKQTREQIWSKAVGCNDISREDVSHSNNQRCKEFNISRKPKESFFNHRRYDEKQQTWWQTQSEFCGVPNGISYELDKGRTNRIKSLGNSIVPQIARELGFAIIQAEQNV